MGEQRTGDAQRPAPLLTRARQSEDGRSETQQIKYNKDIKLRIIHQLRSFIIHITCPMSRLPTFGMATGLSPSGHIILTCGAAQCSSALHSRPSESDRPVWPWTAVTSESGAQQSPAESGRVQPSRADSEQWYSFSRVSRNTLFGLWAILTAALMIWWIHSRMFYSAGAAFDFGHLYDSSHQLSPDFRLWLWTRRLSLQLTNR